MEGFIDILMTLSTGSGQTIWIFVDLQCAAFSLNTLTKGGYLCL